MGRTRKLIGLTALGAAVLPPLAAAVARSRFQESAEDADDLRVAAIFDDRRLAATSPSLRRGEALAWYGALTVDLRGARLDPAGAKLRVVAMFAGARVLVPAGWDVRVRPVSMMGSVSGWTEPPTGPGPAPRLTVEAIAAFSGIEVTDRPVDEEIDLVLQPPATADPAATPPDAPDAAPDADAEAAPDASAAGFERAEAEARLEAAAVEERPASAQPDEGPA